MNDLIHLVYSHSNGADVFVGAESGITTEWLKKNNIAVVVSLNNYATKATTYAMLVGATHHLLPFKDMSPRFQTENDSRNVVMAIHETVNAISEGKNIVIHCAVGSCRSPAVVYAALVFIGIYKTCYDAYTHIRRIRPYVVYRRKFCRWIMAQYRAKNSI